MADEKRVVRTAGVYGNFVLPGLLDTDDGLADLVISPDGVEVDFQQWRAIAEAAVHNQVVVRLDEDFPGELYAAEVAKHEQAKTDAKAESTGSSDPAPVVDGMDSNAQGGGRRRSQSGG